MESLVNYIGPGLAVGLSGIGVAIGEGILAKKSMEVMGKRGNLTTFYSTVTILGIALVESAVIYGLIVAFQMLGNPDMGLWASIGAGLAIGLAGLGVGIGEGKVVAGALEGIDKNPEMKWKIMTYMILFIALVESAAIYGLITSFKIMGSGVDSMLYVGGGLAIGLAGLGVGIGEGILAGDSLSKIGKNPKMSGYFLTVTILGIALVESAAIYGLVIAFQILGSNELGGLAAIGAGLAIGLTGAGAGIGEGLLVKGSLNAMERNPQIKGKIMTFMVLFLALVEVTAIYGLIISLKIIGSGETSLVQIGAGLAIGLAGLGVGIGRGYLSEKALDVMGQNPKMISYFLTVSILGVALVESAAIYGLIVAFQLLGSATVTGMAALAAGLAIGLTGAGAGIGEGLLIKGAMQSMNQNPEMKGRYMVFMILFIALVESSAIYGLIVALKVMG